MTTEELRTIIGENVRNRRKGLRMTQVALAEKCDWSQPKVAQIENGRRTMPGDDFAVLAEALATTPASLLIAENFSPIPA